MALIAISRLEQLHNIIRNLALCNAAGGMPGNRPQSFTTSSSGIVQAGLAEAVRAHRDAGGGSCPPNQSPAFLHAPPSRRRRASRSAKAVNTHGKIRFPGADKRQGATGRNSTPVSAVPQRYCCSTPIFVMTSMKRGSARKGSEQGQLFTFTSSARRSS